MEFVDLEDKWSQGRSGKLGVIRHLMETEDPKQFPHLIVFCKHHQLYLDDKYFKDRFIHLVKKYYQESVKNGTPEDKRWACEQYLFTITDEKGTFFDDSEIEDEMKSLLYGEDSKIRNFLKDSTDPSIRIKNRQFLDRIYRWYLKRYNLAEAKKVLKVIREVEKSGRQSVILKFFHQILNRYSIIAATVALLMVFSISSVLSITWQQYPFSISLFLLYLTILFYTVSIYHFKNLVPRLIGCIIIGYIPLVLTDEIWRFALVAPWWVIMLLCFGALAASYLYLYVEVHNTIRDRVKSVERAVRLFSIGLCQSLVLGLIISDLFSKHVVPHTGSQGALFIPGLLGVVYPRVIFLYVPLALFIGIFIQILWEEKPITQPL